MNANKNVQRYIVGRYANIVFYFSAVFMIIGSILMSFATLGLSFSARSGLVKETTNVHKKLAADFDAIAQTVPETGVKTSSVYLRVPKVDDTVKVDEITQIRVVIGSDDLMKSALNKNQGMTLYTIGWVMLALGVIGVLLYHFYFGRVSEPI